MIGAILLLGLGLALIIAEVLFPSFGVLSVLATAAIAGACYLAFAESTGAGKSFLVATALLVPTAILLGFKIFPKSPMGKYMVARGLSFDSTAATDERDLLLVDHEGEIEAPCRPAGVARIDGRRVDVVSRGDWIGKGQRVRVASVRGNRVVVIPIEQHIKD